jgi:exodeoxyribonuclease VII small subunit
MAKSKNQDALKRGYRELSSELEVVMFELQREDLDVDDALVNYGKGLVLVRELQDYLKTAENKVNELKAKFSS